MSVTLINIFEVPGGDEDAFIAAELMALIADLPADPFQRLPAYPVAPRLRS